MKRVACFCITILFALVIGMGMFPMPVVSVEASESGKEIIILDNNFAESSSNLTSYGILESEVSELTPISDVSCQKLEGYSFIPERIGGGDNNYIDTSINVVNSVKTLSATDYQLSSMALEVWMRLDMKPGQVTRGITFEIASIDETNKISWEIGVDELKGLITREELSELDQKLFSSEDVNSAIIGWVKLTLPIEVATTQGTLISGNKFNFDKLNIKQTSNMASDVEIAFYGIKLVKEGSDAKDRITSYINDYCVVSLLPSASVVNENDEFYYGEIFPQFLPFRSVYSCLYVGDIDYLDGSHSANLKIRVETGQMGSTTGYYAYGSYNFKLASHNYNIAYGFLHDGKFISVLSENIIVSDYGSGVWFENSEASFRVGEKKKINYTVHKAFKNATINFESTNTDVLKIVEVNKTNHYIVVECLKTGTAGVNILIEDSRLEGTEYEDSGITNDDFKIQVQKEKKNVDTTKVMLWIALGILLAGLVYLAVKAIIDSRKIEIK